MISEKITILNETGLHARPASVFVNTAAKFKADLTLSKGEKKANAKSILSVLGLGITKGTEITISGSGPDEEQAVKTLADLINMGINE